MICVEFLSNNFFFLKAHYVVLNLTSNWLDTALERNAPIEDYCFSSILSNTYHTTDLPVANRKIWFNWVSNLMFPWTHVQFMHRVKFLHFTFTHKIILRVALRRKIFKYECGFSTVQLYHSVFYGHMYVLFLRPW